MPVELTHTRNLFLSTDLAGRREVRFAGVAVLASAVLFSAIAPFATKQLAHVPAFIPAYESALVLSDLITAVLLFGQFNFLRSRPLLVLACGYLFTAVIAFVHMLTFPGVFSPTGLLGAGSQSTAWLYMFWHAGFPLFVIVYTFIGGMGRGVPASKNNNRSNRSAPRGSQRALRHPGRRYPGSRGGGRTHTRCHRIPGHATRAHR